MFVGGSCLKLCLSKLKSLETVSNDPALIGGHLVLISAKFTFAESAKFSQAPLPGCWGKFFPLVFTLTCYRVLFFLSLSGILLITLLLRAVCKFGYSLLSRAFASFLTCFISVTVFLQ